VLGLCLHVNAQTLEAHYKIFKSLYTTTENGIRKNIVNLDFDGFLYQQKNRFIYFNRPLYLDKYPDGCIDITIDENNISKIGVPIDSLQDIRYIDFDSLISRSRFDITGSENRGFNVKGNWKPGRIKWQFLSDSKEMNGLKCQKAQWVNANGKLQWVVWFCPDVPVLGGPGYITGLPGIVVEGENKITNEKYVLVSYTSNVNLPAGIFWPQEFNEPFR
jgi:GLPGLI family protein